MIVHVFLWIAELPKVVIAYCEELKSSIQPFFFLLKAPSTFNSSSYCKLIFADYSCFAITMSKNPLQGLKARRILDSHEENYFDHATLECNFKWQIKTIQVLTKGCIIFATIFLN